MAKKRKVTISFFELIDSLSEARLDPIDWNRELTLLNNSNLPGVTRRQGYVDALIYPSPGGVGLALAIERAMGARQRNRSTNARKSMLPDSEDWDPSEESFAYFFDHNVFGIVRTSNAAPSHAAVADWLSIHFPSGKKDSGYKAVPVLDRNSYAKFLRDQPRLNSATFALRPENSISTARGTIPTLVNQITDKYREGIGVEIKLTPGRKRGRESNQDLLFDELINTMEANEKQEFLHRVSVDVPSSLTGKLQPVNLIQDRVTTRVEIVVPSADADGSQLAQNVFAEIRSSYREFRQTIEGIVAPPT